ncbi:alpha/beta hydrolase family protein [Saccharicrinis sp. FJH54]|uniref:alpha/beta hydrolase family protein n=1 Tax=Saccharicrinis sp. FJH54 TaxID=3344665 RepID=UPI0035D4B3E0
MKKLFLFIFALIPFIIFAQKRPVEISDFNDWNSITEVKLSQTGNKISYKLKPGKGDAQTIVYDIEKSENDTFLLSSGLRFSHSADLIAFKIEPSLQTQRDAKKEDLPKNKQPKDSLGIFLYAKDTLIKFPRVKLFDIPEDNGTWVAFTTEEKYLPPKDTTQADSVKIKKNKLSKGGDNMVIFNGSTLDTILIRNVTGFKWSKNGNILTYAVKKEDSVTMSYVNYFNTGTMEQNNIYTVEGEVSKLTTDDEGTQLAWLSSTDTLKTKIWQLDMFNLKSNRLIPVADTLTKSFPEDWAPSEHSNLNFSESGRRLYFGSAPKPQQDPKDTLLSGEKVSVDVWSWTDLELQPRQKINLQREKNRSYTAVYHIKEKKVVQLANKELKYIRYSTKKDKKYALVYTPDPYLRASNWTAKFLNDYYLVDMLNGRKQPLIKGVNSVNISPDENFAVYFQPSDSNYYVTDIKKGSSQVLNTGIPTMLVNEENDIPDDPGNYGIGGWSKNDDKVYIYDRYDIWEVDPKGKSAPVNLTKGRQSRTRYRFIDLEKDQEYIDPVKLQLLNVFNEKTKDAGFANLDLQRYEGPEDLVYNAKYYSNPAKADESEIMYYTQQDCNEYPDLWICNRNMTVNQKISDANLQKDTFIWNTVELVKWRSFNGDELEGLLYKPENFDPEKKYPMMVYFYERNADNLNRFNSIYPSYSTINKTLYTSNGYLVFVPDIKYRIGYPGQSAYECIVSGVECLLDRYSWVDADHMALQGQSWGGYQTAYLVTQTNMFAAAMAGAPVSNMTSAYGGIRWGSGMSRMFQYEHTQSRIGGSLWDKPLLYIENSPLFYANKVKTPLLIMHNDNDGAVPWYQGIEYFVALRRLDKPVWMLTYNNEPHNLKPSSWGNRMDLSTRMKQFFDHYLKDEPAPDWMVHGVKAVDKDLTKGF